MRDSTARTLPGFCATALLVVFVATAYTNENHSTTTRQEDPPKGHLVIGGGGMTAEIRNKTLELAGGPAAKIVVIPHASQRETAGESLAESWRDRGAENVTILDLADTEQAIADIASADLIWMGGGSQTRLMRQLAATGIPEAIKQRYASGAVVGGSSAGAAVMSKSMISGDEVKAEFHQGLGLWPETIVDQHFFARRRFNRLLDAVLKKPTLLGVGIDERTAVFLHLGAMEIVGEGEVLLIDARQSKTGPGGVEGIRMQLLRPASRPSSNPK